jgi:hypothetical protein
MSWVNEYMATKKYDPYYGATQGQDFEIVQPQLKANDVIQSQAPSAGEIVTNTGTSALSGAAVGGPLGAGIAAGGSIASQIIAQRAADARAQRERAANIEQTLGQNQQNAYNSILQSLGRAYR